MPLTWTLWAVIVGGSLVLAAGRCPRALGYLVAAAFTWWVVIGMSFGKVDHDHLALVIAVWVMPSAGRARWTDTRSHERAGWVIRWVQIGVVATYWLSWLTKTVNAGWTLGWPQGHVLAWAVIRRANPVNAQLLAHPWLLEPMQWIVVLRRVPQPGGAVHPWPRAAGRRGVLDGLPRDDVRPAGHPLPAHRACAGWPSPRSSG